MEPGNEELQAATKNCSKAKVFLVTGVTGGLGSALARALNKQGHNVVLSGRNLGKLEALYDSLEAEGNAEPALYPIDLAGANASDYAELASVLRREFGRLDGIAHCAAELGITTPLDVYPADIWQRVMKVNCNAAFMLTAACMPLLKETTNASVTFTVDPKNTAFWGAYGCSKAALLTMAQVLADETEGLRDEMDTPKVAINAVYPGPMRTRLRSVAYSGERPEQSPAPQDCVPAYLSVLLRDDKKQTGQLVNLQSPAL